MNAAVLTVSDRVSRGEADDGSGDLLAECLRADGYSVERRVVADEADEIAAAIEAAVADHMNVINLSLGEPEISPSRDIVVHAIDAAAAAGVAAARAGIASANPATPATRMLDFMTAPHTCGMCCRPPS